MTDLRATVDAIACQRDTISPERSLLVGISGIDASGKGYVAERLVADAERRGLRAAAIGADGWLNLPPRRFNPTNPGEHFYEQAFRFEEMFRELILPLKHYRSCRVVADFTEETAAEYRPHVYEFANLDVILLEGIFLFKSAYRAYFDLTIWVDCTFETALERALTRGQEGLPAEATIAAYQTIYFAAQRIHFARDNPQAVADIRIVNDPRLLATEVAS